MRCSKHPDHTLHPGICSSCLREKLSSITPSYCPSSSISSSRNQTIRMRAYSSSPSLSSSASSSMCASPARKGSHVGAESGSSGLRKSRSLIAFASRKTRGAGKMTIKNKNKNTKDGFWSKLMGNSSSSSTVKKSGGQGGGVFMQSRTSVKNRF